MSEFTPLLDLDQTGYLPDGRSSRIYTSAEKDPRGSRLLPSLIRGTIDDIQLSAKSYQAVNASPEDPDRRGLQSFVRIDRGGIPVYVVDEHHHVLFAWCEALHEGVIQPGATLVHIDWHSDEWAAEEEELPKTIDLKTIYRYILDNLHEGKFVDPAVRLGLLQAVLSVNPELSLKKTIPYRMAGRHFLEVGIDNSRIEEILLSPSKSPSLIVDVDIDFFMTHLKYPSDTLKDRGVDVGIQQLIAHDIDRIRKLIDKASLVTIATSPGYFPNQTEAIKLIKVLLQPKSFTK